MIFSTYVRMCVFFFSIKIKTRRHYNITVYCLWARSMVFIAFVSSRSRVDFTEGKVGVTEKKK